MIPILSALISQKIELKKFGEKKEQARVTFWAQVDNKPESDWPEKQFDMDLTDNGNAGGEAQYETVRKKIKEFLSQHYPEVIGVAKDIVVDQLAPWLSAKINAELAKSEEVEK
ncbi:MAG: hypothetical protein ABIH87_01925 [bacterium]